MKNKSPLVVVDTSVVIHRIRETMETSRKLSRAQEKMAVTAVFAWVVSGEWLGKYAGTNPTIVFVNDAKCLWSTGSGPLMGYWRHAYLEQPEVYGKIEAPTRQRKATRVKKFMHKPLKYKAGRKAHGPIMGRLKDIFYGLIEAHGYPCMSTPGYEADDQAALLVRLNKVNRQKRNIILATVDGDWTQLVDSHTTWFCVKGFYPRVRANVDAINLWPAMHKEIGLAARRYPEHVSDPLTDCHQVATVKALRGDKSDNLPAGSPIEVIDLINPPQLYDLRHQSPNTVRQAKSILRSPGNALTNEKTIDGSIKAMNQCGLRMVITPYNADTDEPVYPEALAA